MAWWIVPVVGFVAVEVLAVLTVLALCRVASRADEATDRAVSRLPAEPIRARRRRGSVCSTRRR